MDGNKAMVRYAACQAVATVAVCGLGVGAMWLSGGKTGIGWAILGVFLIWGHSVHFD